MLALEGYRRRTEEQWDMTRHIMLYSRVYGGMGSEEPVSVTDVMPLRRDEADKVRPITTTDGAKELLNQMLNGTY